MLDRLDLTDDLPIERFVLLEPGRGRSEVGGGGPSGVLELRGGALGPAGRPLGATAGTRRRRSALVELGE